METVQTKVCPLCTGPLPISRFGLCRARTDGRNLYCMSCIREKVCNQRKALKEYKAVQKRIEEERKALGLWQEPEPIKCLRKLSPVERVREAIAGGARTQREIHVETKLGKDEIGDAIAQLLLWTKEIRTQTVDGTRLYFLNRCEEVQRKPCVTSKPLMEYANNFGPLVKGEKSIRRVA